MTHNYDICIVGAGLAGSLMALLANQHMQRVCVLEKPNRSVPQNFLPVETITTSFLKYLSEYDIDADIILSRREIIQKDNKMISAWGTTNTTAFHNENYFTINKLGLLRFVHSILADRQVKVFDGPNYRNFSFIDNKWSITLNAKETMNCSLIVDASGRNSVFSSKQKVDRIFFDDHYAFFQTYLQEHSRENYFILESAFNGWWYSNRSDNLDQTVFISQLKKDKLRSFHEFYFDSLMKTYYVKNSFKHTRNDKVHVKDARCGILSRTTGNHWIAIGDSAFTLDPLSGNGNLAIAENNIAIFAVMLDFLKTRKHNCLEQIDVINNRFFFRHLLQRNTYYKMERRWPQSMFWRKWNEPHLAH